MAAECANHSTTRAGRTDGRVPDKIRERVPEYRLLKRLDGRIGGAQLPPSVSTGGRNAVVRQVTAVRSRSDTGELSLPA